MEKGTGRTGANKGAGSKFLKIGALVLVASGLAWAVNAAMSQPEMPPASPPERSLDAVRQDLTSTLPVVRAQAVVALAQMQDQEAIVPLRTLLHSDSSATVRGVAAIALGSFKDTASTATIAALLAPGQDISPDVVLDALGRMGDPAGAAAVLPLLNADHDVLRLQAVEALVAMQAHAQGNAILRMALANQDVEKAKNFAVVLGKLKVSAAQDYLIGLARDTPASPTLSASYLALGRIGSTKAIAVLSEAIGRDFVKGRENAVEALLLIHSPEALPRMFPYLAHDDREIRFSAAEIIAQTPDGHSGPKLLQALETHAAKVVGPAAYALGRLKYLPAQPTLAALLANPASPEREILARAFGWMGSKDNIPLLIQTLREADGEGRYGAAWSLGILEAAEAVDDLQKAANGNSTKLANLSIEALGMIRSEKSLPYLAQKAQTHPELATTVLASIANLPGTQARLTLEKFANHKDLRLSRPALQGLAQRKDADAVPALIQMIDTATPDNRKQVYFALSAVTGHKYATASEWRSWYAKAQAAPVSSPARD